jgi:hypothetical protein
MEALDLGDVVITPTVDRLSRDTTDLLVIARDMQRAGAGIRSLAALFLDRTSDFTEIIFAILGVAAKLASLHLGAHRARPGRCQGTEASNSAASRPSPPASRRRPASASKPARRSGALPTATMSVRARFHGSRFFPTLNQEEHRPAKYYASLNSPTEPRDRLPSLGVPLYERGDHFTAIWPRFPYSRLSDSVV